MACRRAVAVLLCVLPSACTTAEVPGPENDMLEGVPTREIGLWVELPPDPWSLADTPTLVLGGDDERSSHQFVEVTAGTRMTDGAMIVADASGSAVRVFEPGGRFRLTLGARGEGPGEFRAPTDVVVGRGDSIRVWDQALWRSTTFDATGGFVRAERYDPTHPEVYPLEGMWPMRVSLGRDDRVLVRLADKSQKGPSGGVENDFPAGFALHHVGSGEAVMLARMPDQETAEVEAPWGLAEVAPALASGPEVAFDRTGRACLGHGAVPQVLCVDASGGRRGLRWVDQPREVASGDPALSRWQADAVASYAEKLGRDQAEGIVSLVPMPRNQPAFRGLIIDALGYLWIDVGSDGHVSRRRHIIVDADMEPLGLMTLPDVELLEVGEDYVLAVGWAESGTEQVVVYPLTR